MDLRVNVIIPVEKREDFVLSGATKWTLTPTGTGSHDRRLARRNC